VDQEQNKVKMSCKWKLQSGRWTGCQVCVTTGHHDTPSREAGSGKGGVQNDGLQTWGSGMFGGVSIVKTKTKKKYSTTPTTDAELLCS
jgi:hypothetical protein